MHEQKILSPRKSALALAVALGVVGQVAVLANESEETATHLPTSDASRPSLGREVSNPPTSVNEIAVTSTRVVRDGYGAPTPTTVISTEALEAVAASNIPDLVNQMPSVVGSAMPTTQRGQISNGGTAINALSLRNLGPNRTLVLVDGKRLPISAISTALTDTNGLPNALIERVDIVTGGASAAWGSDAVAGVVNFVLDTDYTGFKSHVQGGTTSEGDNDSILLSATYGSPFANQRGHFLVSLESYQTDGIDGLPRDWYTGAKRFNNPDYTDSNGLPEYLVLEGAGFSNLAPGAIVTGGPLRGVYFGEGGVPGQIDFGPITGAQYMWGGDWAYTDFGKGPQDLLPEIERENIFVRASYQLSDRTEVYGEFSLSDVYTQMDSTPQFNFGGINIRRDNAFLPAEVASQMDAHGLDSLDVGSWNADLGGIRAVTERDQKRYILGMKGELDFLSATWHWDAYANRNVSDIFNLARATVSANYRAAIDAVRNDRGDIVCRSTLEYPDNGCVPLNILGTGTVSEQAKAYVLGDSILNAKYTQDVYAASMQGEPFSNWAGPVSLAFGGEHRREKLKSSADERSLQRAFWAGNFAPYQGEFDVTEVFAEAILPILSGAQEADINLATRWTDYSTSGDVTTWKVGLNYSPIEDVRFRVTQSRDIRAGTMPELFAEGQSQNFSITDPFRDNENTNYYQVAGGNPDLKPEKADTSAMGIVYQPRFIPGLSTSLDYFSIDIEDATTTHGGGTILNQCYDGQTALCSEIIRDGEGRIETIYVRPVNLANRKVEGFDFNISYGSSIGAGTALEGDGYFSLQAVASHYTKAETDNGIDSPVSQLETGIPEWLYRIQAMYEEGPLGLSLVARGSSSLKYGNDYIVCEANCPPSVAGARTINDNHISGPIYFDASVSYTLRPGVEVYLVVDNLTDRDPEPHGAGPGVGSAPLGVNAAYHDLIGRSFRSGIRINF